MFLLTIVWVCVAVLYLCFCVCCFVPLCAVAFVCLHCCLCACSLAAMAVSGLVCACSCRVRVLLLLAAFLLTRPCYYCLLSFSVRASVPVLMLGGVSVSIDVCLSLCVRLLSRVRVCCLVCVRDLVLSVWVCGCALAPACASCGSLWSCHEKPSPWKASICTCIRLLRRRVRGVLVL